MIEVAHGKIGTLRPQHVQQRHRIPASGDTDQGRLREICPGDQGEHGIQKEGNANCGFFGSEVLSTW